MSRVDLHIHTDASDGQFSPAEVVSRAAARGLSVIAITDHDTTNGIDSALEAARSFPALQVIPGIEVSTDIPAGEAHILGYFINHADAELQAALEKMRNSRRERARKMVARLADIGCVIEWERVLEIAGSATVGRPHIAQVLIGNGCIDSFKDAFTRYIGRDGPAY
ncbi:MAG TPA: PHP domain-containing protein, partial [Dehalococcoidia bacterium]|nr:PHP domain-containing protein [Dehalococcoidia bacterium]